MSDIKLEIECVRKPPIYIPAYEKGALITSYIFHFYVDDKHYYSELSTSFVKHLMKLFNLSKPIDLAEKIEISLDPNIFQIMVPHGSSPSEDSNIDTYSDDFKTIYFIKTVPMI